MVTDIPGRRITASLEASGGSMFRNTFGAAKGALIRAAASIETITSHEQG
jgi:hypothetical protein